MFGNGVLREIVGFMRDKVTVGKGRLKNWELNNFHASPDIIRIIESREITWAGHVESMKR
jgi:hypothetical protein